MDAADINDEDVDDLITLIDYEQYRFGCYALKEKASRKSEDYQLSENQTSIKNKKYLNISETSSVRCSSLKIDYECPPVSIKLVDCAKFPWYYKLNQKMKPSEDNVEINKNFNEPDQLSSESDVDDLICLNQMCVKHKVVYNPKTTHTVRCNESEMENCFCNEKQYSNLSKLKLNRSNVTSGYSGINNCTGIDFKKNRGLIGMKVRHRISTNKLTQTGDIISNYESLTNSINTRDLALSRSPIKVTKSVYNKIITEKTEPGEINLKENIFVDKETSLNRHDNSTNSSNGILQKSSSPILKITVKNKKATNRNLQTKVTAHMTEDSNMGNTFFNSCLKTKLKKDDQCLNDYKFSEIGTKKGESNTSPILNSNIRNKNKFLQNLESRPKSPIFPCKINIKRKISDIIPQQDISIDCQDAINDEKHNLYYLKKNSAHEQNSFLEDKQKKINFSIKNKRNQMPIPVKLNNIVDSLYKRKLQQRDNSRGNEIVNSKDKTLQIKSSNHSHEIEQVNMNTTCKINQKENKVTNNLSLKNTNNTESCKIQSSSQPICLSTENCNSNLKAIRGYDKNSIPFKFKCRYQKQFISSLESGPAIRHRIPHRHIRIPPVSSVLLNSTKTKHFFSSIQIPKQTISLEQDNNAKVSKHCAINSTIDPWSTSKKTVTEFNSDNVSQNNVQREEVTDNEFLKEINERKGYSPPILPIPTYQTTFEYLRNVISGRELNSVAQNTSICNFGNQMAPDFRLPLIYGGNPISVGRKFCTNTDNNGMKDSSEKRKLNTVAGHLNNKMSLSVYKMRIDELGHESTGESLGNKLCRSQDANLYPGPLSYFKSTRNRCLESEDVGYDSDRTLLF